jgi:hypothetical protein
MEENCENFKRISIAGFYKVIKKGKAIPVTGHGGP